MWLRWASEDLVMAERAHLMEGFVPRGVCMWSHQSGEKAVKALLVAYDIDPPKQHDLARLALRLPPAAADALLAIDRLPRGDAGVAWDQLKRGTPV